MVPYEFPYKVETLLNAESHMFSWRFTDIRGNMLSGDEFKRALGIYLLALKEIPNCLWGEEYVPEGISGYPRGGWHVVHPRGDRPYGPIMSILWNQPLDGTRILPREEALYKPHIQRFGSGFVKDKWDDGLRTEIQGPAIKPFSSHKDMDNSQFHLYKMAETLYRNRDKGPEFHQQGKVLFPEMEYYQKLTAKNPAEWKPRFGLDYTIHGFPIPTRDRSHSRNALTNVDSTIMAIWRITDRDGSMLEEDNSAEVKLALAVLMDHITEQSQGTLLTYKAEICYPHIAENKTIVQRFVDKLGETMPAEGFMDENTFQNRLEFDYDISQSLIYWKFLSPEGTTLKKRFLPRVQRQLTQLLRYMWNIMRISGNSNRLLRGIAVK